VFRRASARGRLAISRVVLLAFRALTKSDRIPEGGAFFTLTSTLEQRCAAETDLALHRAGEKAPRCFSELGTVLSLLDRLSSCWWGCRGGDHVPEHLVGRALGDLRSAVQLFRFGYYDESLALTRNAGEVVNLLQLFASDSSALDEWKALPSRERWTRYKPSAVRAKLARSDQVLISAERYARLSEVATHVTPNTRPQAHNPFGIPSQAPVFQPPGMLLALNEAAVATALLMIPATALIDHGRARRLELLHAGRRLGENIGRADILEIQDWYAEVRSAAVNSRSAGTPAEAS
jgi:hypothetical protein